MSHGLIDRPLASSGKPVNSENRAAKRDATAASEFQVQAGSPDKNAMIAGLQFHHIGMACRDIDAELRALAMVGYELEGNRFTDPLQKVRGCFLAGPGPRVELLAPLDDSSPVVSWLEKGIKMYHQAYEVESIDLAIATLTAQRAVVLSVPKPAVAFGGRKVAFLMLPNLMLVELIEL
jgi:glyoxalase/bleomycin resistance protein/dioxygenase superfamily protein